MSNFIKTNKEYKGVDTNLANETLTLIPIAGKDYQVANTGNSANTLTVNYGTSSTTLFDGDVMSLFYDGSVWITDSSASSGGSSTSVSSPAYVQSQGIIVPLYIYPADIRNNVEWNALIDLKRNFPTVPYVAVINPSNGPGTVVDGNYAVGIKRLQSANIKVVGYVSTDYANRDLDLVNTDIDNWKILYPEIEGIFFDELTYASSPTNLTYYTKATNYAKSKSMEILVTNPGLPFSKDYIPLFDIIIGWESDVFPTLAQAQEDYVDGASEYPYLKRGFLLHSQSSLDITLYNERVLPYYGWQYITSDTMPNPWDTLSTYLEEISKRIVRNTASSGTDAILGEDVSTGMALQFGTDGKLYKADNRSIDSCIVSGVALYGGVAGDTMTVGKIGVLDAYSGLVVGSEYYLGYDGDIVVKGGLNSTEYRSLIGTAIADNTIDLFIQPPEPTVNSGSILAIGDTIESGKYKDRRAEGLWVASFDNAISKANYPAAWDAIGDIYRQQHLDAGDADPGVDFFFPTMIPGAYSRSGISDSAEIDATADVDISTNRITLSSTDYTRFAKLKIFTGSSDAVAILLKGTLPTGLNEDTIYYIRFRGSDEITLYATEHDAMANENVIDITATATGPFRLTQEGIKLKDAFQGFVIKAAVDGSGAVAGAKAGVGSRETPGDYIKKPVTDGTNGTPRIANETRPITTIAYKYVKIEHVTSSGETISALREVWEEIGRTSWEEENITISHNLKAHAKDLNIKVEFWKSGLANYQEIKDLQLTSTGGGSYGVGIENATVDSFILKIGSGGFFLIGASNNLTSVVDTVSCNIRITITKPNLVTTIFDTSQMPREYDISAEDIEVVLPDLTGVLQTREYSWIGGGHTGTFTVRHPDGTSQVFTGSGSAKYSATTTSTGAKWKAVKIEENIFVDTSAGNVSISILDGSFISQKVKVLCDGSGLAYVTFTGKLATGDVPISDGLAFNAEWDGTKWVVIDEVTAEYVSGSITVIQTSIGDTNFWISGFAVGGSGSTLTWPIILASSIYIISVTSISDAGLTLRTTTATRTTTNSIIYLWDSSHALASGAADVFTIGGKS